MFHKLGICLFIILLSEYVLTAPHSPPQTQQELIKDIAEFLKEDKEISVALKNIDLDHFRNRNRRDAVDDGLMEVENVSSTQDTPQEGFFDKAAKFIMQVLQRFLKWLNTDN
ncbi:hypothetical protein WA026_020749 [Henosepilachna vigintioctopunctata]|uniref:Uncharacterized protein n=1 Tax=Henosepilachna vigintioctopunctata TaxID=420089 RepID=A0AAW1UBQ2_9CUCU